MEVNVGTHSTRGRLPGRIALINMPFALADRPSIQCGLLKGYLQQAGHSAEVFYFNLELALELGQAAYATIAQLRTDQLLGDWLFSAAAFGITRPANEYFEACASVQQTCVRLNLSTTDLSAMQEEQMPAWIRRCAAMTDWTRFSLIGFSSTFEQNTASLALARAIRELYPNVKIVFGGANFDGEMGQEYLRVLPYIDFVIGGEGERPLLALLDDLAAGGTGTGIAGVLVKDCSNESVLASPPVSPLQDIDELPDPDYEEYFATLFRLGREKVLGDSPPLLLYESARGCWWGQKHHCTFCGLNNSNMAFRSRSPNKLREQLRRMADRYKIVNFEAVDNIMDLSYLKELFEPLASERLDYQLFYELKSNLIPSQLRTLARAGVRTVQPGIESLSTHVLRLMRKGVSMIQNVRFLKWAHYYGMRVGWNILTGFPGETIEDYQQQLDIIPLLQHLPPPSGCGPIWLERFSPFYFDKSFPIREIRPRPAYRFIYPEETFDIRKIAYFFDHESDIDVPPQMYSDLYALVEQWKGSWANGSPPVMVYQRAPDWIQIIDRRTDEVTVHAVSGWEALAYEFCGETESSVASIAQRLKNHHHEVSPERIKESLDDLCAQGLMLGEDGRYFSLAFPVNGNW